MAGILLLIRSLTAALSFDNTAATSASVMSSRLSRSFSLSLTDRAGRYWGASVSSPLLSTMGWNEEGCGGMGWDEVDGKQ